MEGRRSGSGLSWCSVLRGPVRAGDRRDPRLQPRHREVAGVRGPGQPAAPPAPSGRNRGMTSDFRRALCARPSSGSTPAAATWRAPSGAAAGVAGARRRRGRRGGCRRCSRGGHWAACGAVVDVRTCAGLPDPGPARLQRVAACLRRPRPGDPRRADLPRSADPEYLDTDAVATSVGVVFYHRGLPHAAPEERRDRALSQGQRSPPDGFQPTAKADAASASSPTRSARRGRGDLDGARPRLGGGRLRREGPG